MDTVFPALDLAGGRGAPCVSLFSRLFWFPSRLVPIHGSVAVWCFVSDVILLIIYSPEHACFARATTSRSSPTLDCRGSARKNRITRPSTVQGSSHCAFVVGLGVFGLRAAVVGWFGRGFLAVLLAPLRQTLHIAPADVTH